MKNNKEKFRELIDNIIKNGHLDKIGDDGGHILRYVEIYIIAYKGEEIPHICKSLNEKTVGTLVVDPALWSEDLIARFENKMKELLKQKELDDKIKAQKEVLDTIGVFSNEMLTNEYKMEEDIKKRRSKETEKSKAHFVNRNKVLRALGGCFAFFLLFILSTIYFYGFFIAALIALVIDLLTNYKRSMIVGYLLWSSENVELFGKAYQTGMDK